MKAMIFAAGIGSRLKPFTDSHPKALVPVGGVPMLERVIVKLKESGINRMVVNVHHFAPQITAFLQSHDYFGCEIAISDETKQLLDTGGGLLNARHLLEAGNEPILLHNADILTDFPLEAMIGHHTSHNCAITLMVSKRDSSRMLYFDSSNHLKGWQNLKTGEIKPVGKTVTADLTPLAFGGVHIVNPSIFGALSEYRATSGTVFSIMPFYLSYLDKLNIGGYQPQMPFSWFDVGSASKLAAAETACGASHDLL